MAHIEKARGKFLQVGRNGYWRRLVKGPREYISSKIPPEIPADFITFGSFFIIVDGAIKTTHLNGSSIDETSMKQRLEPAAELILGAFGDAFDGPQAVRERENLSEEEAKKHEELGQLKDAMTDRLATLVKGVVRAIS